MNRLMVIQSQLLATKFFVPVTPGTLIPRPRLTALLQRSLSHPLTLVSAPAGFGKTTLLASWIRSLPAHQPLVAWVSLDDENNDPQLFWTYVLSALDQQQPERFTPLLKYLQSSQAPPLMYVLTALSNLLLDSSEHFLLVLDDYHVINQQQVHSTLLYLVEHIPPQLHIILATRIDPPLSLSLLRTRGLLLEVRTEQLRCTAEETKAFFREVMSIHLSDEAIQEVLVRTEGWLVGLQLLGLSLPQQANPERLLQEVSGDQRYILDYLTEEVLRQEPQEIQTFLLSTCILRRLTASLCDAVMEQTNSQQMLEHLERANLFVVSLDSKRQWYRYHALFAEALYYRLTQTHHHLVLSLHHRASLWYARHGFPSLAILHALRAKEWNWAADLIEGLPSLLAHSWGASEHELILLQHWIKQLPTEVVHSRPRLCLICAELLWLVTPGPSLQAWLDAAKASLTTSLATQALGDSSSVLVGQARQDQQDLLGEVIAFCANLQSFQGKKEITFSLCQQALDLLSAENRLARGLVTIAQLIASYPSAANDTIESGLQIITQAWQAEQPTIDIMGIIIMCMVGAGRLHEAEQLIQQAIGLGTQPRGLILPEVSLPMLFQAYLLCEWNQLDAALSLAEKAISLSQQIAMLPSLVYLLFGYSVLLHIHLARGDLDRACWALQQFERLGTNMYQPTYLYSQSHFTTVDRVRLWLACGKLDRAPCWKGDLDLTEEYDIPFAQERQEVAYIRVLLAKNHLTEVPQRLQLVLERADAAQRMSHVIEIRLLQALAHHMCHEEKQALSALSEAVRLAEPEGYIRSFVDEGAAIATLLSKLRDEQRKQGPTPYLDTLLATFPKSHKAQKHLLKCKK